MKRNPRHPARAESDARARARGLRGQAASGTCGAEGDGSVTWTIDKTAF
ncbi:MAG: hypothetical protein ACLTG4_02465 [Oscillospiraceae bacterium]